MTLAYLARNAASAERLRNDMLRTGYTHFGDRLWTEHEDFLCRLFYPDYFALRQILYTRSEGAIKARCQKLGLVPTRHRWSPLERMKLRRLYPSATHRELLAAFPGVSLQQIRRAARYYGYRRNRKPYKVTGVRALDQVRQQCFEIGWTMRDADEEARTKAYFRQRGHKSSFPNFRAINRLARALGGNLTVVWLEDD